MPMPKMEFFMKTKPLLEQLQQSAQDEVLKDQSAKVFNLTYKMLADKLQLAQPDEYTTDFDVRTHVHTTVVKAHCYGGVKVEIIIKEALG